MLLAILAFVAMVGSAVYWWGVQSQLTPNVTVALAYTAILVLAPPALISFLIPWSPAGMLLQKVNARTWGYTAVVACSLFLLYYSFQIQWSWWSAQQVVEQSGLVYQQVLIGIIGFIIIPALLWTPVTSEELVEQVRQAHLVKRYELQTQADIAILRATLLRTQEQALIGFANLTVAEREELAASMRGLVAGIDQTLREVGQSVKTVSGATVHFDALEDNEDIRDVLEYIGDSLVDSTLSGDAAPALPAPQRGQAQLTRQGQDPMLQSMLAQQPVNRSSRPVQTYREDPAPSRPARGYNDEAPSRPARNYNDEAPQSRPARSYNDEPARAARAYRDADIGPSSRPVRPAYGDSSAAPRNDRGSRPIRRPQQ